MPPQTRSSDKRTTRSSIKQNAENSSTQNASTPQIFCPSKLSSARPRNIKHKLSPRKHSRHNSPKIEPEHLVVPSKRVQAKQNKSSGFVNIPIDIFAEIATYLYPIDLVSLARTNRSLRHVLMSHSSIHIWKAAEVKVEGLPPCPEDLCEPQYAALLFTKYCSVCGDQALRQMDAMLRVRLCVKCRDQQAIETSKVTDDTLVFASRALVPGKHQRDTAWCLYQDARAVKDKLNDLEREGNEQEAERWKTERRNIVYKRIMDSQLLAVFISRGVYEHSIELDAVRREREAEVKSRLLELGWEKQDIDVYDKNWMRAWKSAAWIAKPLTERAWEDILPTLIFYLESNRTRRLERERRARWQDRRDRLYIWTNSIRRSIGPFAQALDIPQLKETGSYEEPNSGSGGTDAQSPTGDATIPDARILRMAYPHINEILDWPVFKNLVDTEMSLEDFDRALEQLKPTLDQLVVEWRQELEQKLVGLLPDESTASNQVTTSNIDENFSTQAANLIPEYSLVLGTGNPITSLPANMQRLLRSDCVFALGGTPMFYPEFFYAVQPSIEGLVYHTQGAKVAKALLAQLGLPNATCLQLAAAEVTFLCGRCVTHYFFSWESLIRHYMTEAQRYAPVPKKRLIRSSVVKYVFMHDVNAVIPDRPLMRVIAKEEREVTHQELVVNGGPYRVCLECKLIGLGYCRKENSILDHIRSVSDPYDPYLPRGGSSANPSGEPGRPGGNTKTAAIQQQIDDTVGIMRENITRVAERGERLDVLQDKTDNLAVNAQGFRRGANRVRKNMWWKDMKMRIIIGVGIAILIVIIVVPIVKAVQNK